MRPADRSVDLQHLPAYRVLLCRACSYCVLPHALDRHLKDIHHLTRRERDQLLNDVLALDLAESSDVRYPSPGNGPVPGMPVHAGLICGVAGCNHLCVAMKRMQAHWRTKHGERPATSASVGPYCRRVKLQTFFRGNFLHYFVVSGKPGSTNSPEPDSSSSGSELVLRNSPSLPDSNEATTDWLLARQFFESSHTGFFPVKGTNLSWRDKLLQTSHEFDFLRLAMLSVTASQVAYARPESRAFYGQQADHYRQLSIQSMSRRVKAVNSDNFYAVFNFSRLMTVCCIAGVQLRCLEDTAQPEATGAAGDPVLTVPPPWVHIQQLGAALVFPHAGGGRIGNAMHGPVQRLYAVHLMQEQGLHLNPYDGVLAALLTQLEALSHSAPASTATPTASDDLITPDSYTQTPLYNSNHNINSSGDGSSSSSSSNNNNSSSIPQVSPACLDALRTLRRVWAVPYREPANGFRDVALMWSARVPRDFVALLRARDPPSLVVFAHYCVLWGLAEAQYWYMHGLAARMLAAVVHALPAEWLGWIAWPIERVFGGGGGGGGLLLPDGYGVGVMDGYGVGVRVGHGGWNETLGGDLGSARVEDFVMQGV